MTSYFYRACIWQVDGSTDLLEQFVKNNSDNHHLLINYENKCLELFGVDARGGESFMKEVDNIKIIIESKHGRVIAYDIKEIAII